MLLSFIGGAFGILLSVALTRGLISLIPADQPLLVQPTPDLRILLFTFSLTLVTGVVFGLLPALRASNPDQWATLKDTVGGIAGTGGSLFLRKGLVAAQVALSFLLLFGAGLFVRSLQNLQTTDTGVALDNLITFRLNPALSGYENQQGVNFYRELLDRLNSSPGVKSAGTAAVAILAGDEWDSTMSVEGHQAKDGEDMQAFMNSLSPGYFKTMEIPFLEGRDFTRADAREEATVAIVNQKFAKHFFGDKSAVGRRIGFGLGPESKLYNRDRRRRRGFALRGTARGRAPAGVHPQLGPRRRDLLHADDRCLGHGLQPGAQRGEAPGCGHAGVRHEDGAGPAG